MEIKIVAFGDTFGCHSQIPQNFLQGDILIHCGNAFDSHRTLESFFVWFGSQTNLKIFIPSHREVGLLKEIHGLDLENVGSFNGVCILVNRHLYAYGLKIYGYCGGSSGAMATAMTMDKAIDIVASSIPPRDVMDKPMPHHRNCGDLLLKNFLDHFVHPRICVFAGCPTPGFRMNQFGTQMFNVSIGRENIKGGGHKIIYEPTTISYL